MGSPELLAQQARRLVVRSFQRYAVLFCSQEFWDCIHSPDSSTKAAQALAGTGRGYCEVMGESTASPYFLQRGESMSEARIEIFKKMINDDPNNTTIRFGLANELLKLERFEEAANELKAYLSQTDDQGNAYGKLAQALERLGRVEEAREAYQQGINAANRHGHPGMAQEFEMALDDLI
jgi:tetratricopeptide (TPR) repeat protein